MQDGRRRAGRDPACSNFHFRLPETSRKVLLRRVPKLVNAVMMAIAISDAISAYSMAVAPDSLAMNTLMRSVMIFFQGPGVVMSPFIGSCGD